MEEFLVLLKKFFERTGLVRFDRVSGLFLYPTVAVALNEPLHASRRSRDSELGSLDCSRPLYCIFFPEF
ncbi:hypothetical protein PUN28_008591 [Cardiocondyla obscurior]|uniref:Uncharacterized protein n=1 Tax=Cardiocondyla obscurior TaxID=286306 RepID=A0AAW2FYW2_9HYME